jgi:uncharacterized protein YdeI (BOF family)
MNFGILLAGFNESSHKSFLRCPMKKFMLSVAGALLVLTAVPKIASAASLSDSRRQESQQKMKIFSGTIVKNGDNFVLSDAANKLSYILDDPRKASQYEGKKVKVTGTVDVASNTIHVETIQEIA